MHVEHLLRLDSLDLTLVWGDESLLGQEIGGVTATDLEDPTRFLQPGEIVLSGLVWWNPADGPARTERFVSALREAGAAALLAGEETHGEVPRELAEACRRHRIALLAVPAHTSFRAITEAVYLRQWGELSRRPSDLYALPENVRGELERELERGVSVGDLLESAFAHLGTPPCHLLTGSGRTIARTATAAELPARRASESLRGARGAQGTTLRVEADDTAFDAWYLHLADEGQVPPRVLHEIAEVLGRHRRRHDRRRASRRQAGQELAALLDIPHADTNAVENALSSCGLPGRGGYTVVVASATPAAAEEEEGADAGSAAAALAEALSHLPGISFAVGARPGGEALAVIAHDGIAHDGIAHDGIAHDGIAHDAATHGTTAQDTTAQGGVEGVDRTVRAALGETWPLVHACRPASALYAGVSEPVAGPAGLGAAVGQARYALAAAARTAAPHTAHVTAAEDLTSLEALLAGVPDDVREVYRTTVLGPLLRAGRSSNALLLETLEVFLAHNCSWARTAETLHLHVNTVHYRVQRVETLTGRDLSRLDHRLDLRAALLCR
ncbi:helix-turn-helix domain-containing protein [Streptomyces gardneri]|uniref:helix-turn-helix domain-containing protein n=1 Tax=Streptomyces gardneri TaxID=66892 RepID=UPI0036BA9E46